MYRFVVVVRLCDCVESLCEWESGWLDMKDQQKSF